MEREGESKPRPSLLLEDFAPALMDALTVIEYGTGKHGVRDWMTRDAGLFREAFYRHVLAGLDRHDPETGLLHLDHALVNLLMLKMRMRNATSEMDEMEAWLDQEIRYDWRKEFKAWKAQQEGGG